MSEKKIRARIEQLQQEYGAVGRERRWRNMAEGYSLLNGYSSEEQAQLREIGQQIEALRTQIEEIHQRQEAIRQKEIRRFAAWRAESSGAA